MDQGPLAERIVAEFDGMSAQLQTAARYMLDHPSDVALLSMREQARQAGVQPATMTRLAQHLGFEGYDVVRDSYAAAVRSGYPGFAGKAGVQLRSQKLKGDRAQAAEMLDSLAAQFAQLARPDRLDRIVAAARRLSAARRIYCLGLRSSHPVAWHIHYVLSLVGEKSVLLDGVAGTGADAIGRATNDDVLLVASVLPYTRQTVEVAEYAAGRGVCVVAITDSEVAPLAQIAAEVILVPTQTPSFLHTMAPAFAVAEILAAVVAGHGGEQALAEIRRTDEHHAALNVHLKPRLGKK
ncbi:MurR/RpiR family transcriptional regulator [Mesorhizobium sp. B2-1-8]|uniref:MurR/RpiR family transcriptional regulator n=1 Tax=unclassified Mesorhizobium TaxID=325217 RepID=UPI00112E3B06|nr:MULTISPECIES: MurR/RpiR family transcriptional regulator [unclassified Mesorhizobium]MBZ9706290.1 MurR/RpiR family transcriptional regulator [Mesorhizobium sp. ESP7-2]TPI29841.1 MurR/RpiR family transcriptional regulator [Mesorhizobium sp. B3-2-1]UCI21762.1 MurR/RpiR family transcriptional regulator [Mesorhizobium sp. B2-1-8]